MIVIQTERITDQPNAAQASLLSLNNLHARETSFLTPETWKKLLENAFAATCVGGKAAFLIAFDHQATYENFNFVWLRTRLTRFVYVDRVVVSDEHRGEGLGTHLYHDLIARAQNNGLDKLVCEVNVDPPNPGSDTFHQKLGFTEIGQASLPHADKTVRYLVKNLD
ncbi:MAG: GNAT family N-acetyltransferase [Rhodospirillaceae bacterium]|jgi:uncharacterized protein|nr:GNAT family N-acetyltransferase [Rhodospirillaceae bacterium]